MSPNIIELLFFAGLAFFLISKLMSILGSTSREEQDRFSGSLFGEYVIRDVTNTVTTESKNDISEDLIIIENKEGILNALADIRSKVPKFDIASFVKNSKSAFEMIIEAAKNHDNEALEYLIDKRFINSFMQNASQYSLMVNVASISARLSEIYTFGNNVFAKVLFRDTENIFYEEWTFTKSASNKNPTWFLSNISTKI